MTKRAISSIHAWSAFAHPRHRGSLMSSHAKIAGSSRYRRPVKTFTRSIKTRAFASYIRLHARSVKKSFLLAFLVAPDQSRYCATPPLYSQ